MDAALADRLLASIEADALVLLCGAGLSLAAPSNLPSARRMAEQCASKYQHITGTSLPDDLRLDLGNLAQFFYDQQTLQALFLRQLVEWAPFLGSPNVGHEAIADFLACKAIMLGVTTNVDALIENAAKQLGEPDFRAAVIPPDLNTRSEHAPLLKLHGCANRSRDDTVWCVGQLEHEPVRGQLESFRTWLTAQLQQRDLLVIGFWSDWAYLNRSLAVAVVGTEPRSVTLVDPDDPAALQQKAPELWDWAHSGAVHFHHVQEHGEVFLNELRTRFSHQFVKRLIDNARPEYERRVGPCGPALDTILDHLQTLDLYNLRRSFCGEPLTAPARRKRPGPDQIVIGVVHLSLVGSGAVLNCGRYNLQGRTIRILLASGQFLSSFRGLFEHEPPAISTADMTICVGAYDDGGVPANIVRSAEDANIVRGGTQGEWVTETAFFAEMEAADESHA